jgi:hypothetical protein
MMYAECNLYGRDDGDGFGRPIIRYERFMDFETKHNTLVMSYCHSFSW